MNAHYTAMDIQPWDVVATWPLDQQVGFLRGNIIKYVMRAGSKGPAFEDYTKAAHYLDRLIRLHAKDS